MYLPRLLALAAVVAVLAPCAAPAREEKAKEPDLLTRIKDIKGPFTMIVAFKVKAGEEKTLLATAKDCIASTRKEAGCVYYDLHQDVETPTKFVFVERWKSADALKEHINAEYTKKLVGHVGKVADGAVKIDLVQSADEK